MHLPQGLKGHFGKVLKSTILYRRSFLKIFSLWKNMAIWSTINEFWFFWIFCFSSFGHIFQHISITVQRLCFWERTGCHLSFETNFNEIEQKKCFFGKSKAIPLKNLQFSKLKKFCQIKNLKMQIDRYGSQKCCTLNRLKISQKWRPPWLFQVCIII